MFLSSSPTTGAEVGNAPFHIEWRVYPRLDLIQLSGMLSGIAALERRNIVSLSVSFKSPVVDASYAVMELVVTEKKTGRVRNVVIDFYDKADRIAADALRFADVYFKRQFGPETRAAAPDGSARKIVPAGLTVAGYSLGALRHVCVAIFASLRSPDARRSRKALVDVLRLAYKEARLWAALKPSNAAIGSESDVKEQRIVFQPRLWPTTPGSRDQFDVANDDRIAIVRALRAAFPNERAVGLLHSEMSARVAPDLELAEHITTSKYYRQLRSSLVTVNCVGLSGSVGWKFAEYLAAGNAVVSPPIDKQLLGPIVEGVHYLAYHSPEECVELCRRLLSDDAFSKRMCDVNRRYFLEWVDPPTHLTHLFRIAFA